MNSDSYDIAMGVVLSARRRRMGLAKADMALALRSTEQQVARYEAGTNKVSVSRLFEIADILGTEASTLVMEVEALSMPQYQLPRAK